MTTPALMARIPGPSASAPRFAVRPSTAALPASRIFEVAALRADGSQTVSQHKAPALPLFEAAFSAFARGTVLDGADGAIAIEDLQPGDWLRTSSGEPAQVTWIGSSNFVPADIGRRTPLVRIMADTFGLARPESFLSLGPAARLLQTPHQLQGTTGGAAMLTPIQAFVDGVNVIEVVPPTPVRLFHLCLTRHAAIFAGGLKVETFHPGANATRSVSHAVRDLFLSMFPRIAHVSDFGPLAHPRAPELDENAA